MDLNSLYSNIVCGVVASFVFGLIVLAFKWFLFKPRIIISKRLSLQKKGKEKIIRVKIVNINPFKLINVDYCMFLCKVNDDEIMDVKQVTPKKEKVSILFAINWFRCRKNTDYAIRLSFPLPTEVDNTNYKLNFIIQATHIFSGTTKCFKKEYWLKDIKDGKFPRGLSTTITNH